MNKFAIYRSGIGMYYYKYIDTLEALAGSGFEEIITEEQLPVVLDDAGGYFKFNAEDHQFVKLAETEDDVPLTLEQMFSMDPDKFKLGWVSPDGDLYSCSYTNHNKCAEMLAAKFFPDAKYPELALGRKGWIKVIDSWDGKSRKHGQYVYSDNGRLTRRQADRLFDLGLYKNAEVKKLIAACEGEW